MLIRSLAVAATLVAMCAVPAWADAPTPAPKPKRTRSPNVVVDVTLSDRVKPIVATPPTAPPAPALTADAVMMIEGLVGVVRDAQEQILVDLIHSTPDSDADEKADYYARLGEIYAKQQRYWRLESTEKQIAADRTPAAPQHAALERDAVAATDKAKQFMLKAVKTYAALTSNDAFRRFPRMDAALFFYGYTLQAGKYVKEARTVYNHLLEDYPNSKYVPEAHLAFADYYFEANQLDDAEARYKQVLKFPQSPAYNYALYKLGWIQLNKQRFQDALETFYQVAQATKSDPKQAVLNRSAKKDFVRAYAEIGKADKAYAAFQRVDGKFAFDMLQILGDLYLGQGKSDKAIFVYQQLMAAAPKHKDVCLWQYDIAHAELSLQGAPNADKVTAIANLVRLWTGLKATKILPTAEAQDCHDNAAAMSGELARAYHSEAARTKNFETLAFAERLYKLYLDAFPDADDFAQTQYFYAELLWSRAEAEKNARLQTAAWERAALGFTDVVKTGKASAALLKESAYASVLGWQNAVAADPRTPAAAPTVGDLGDAAYAKVPAPLPIPERDQKMLAAFEVYVRYIKDPKDVDLIGMKFLEADVYRRYNHFAEAVPLFADIVEHHRDHEAAESAARLLLDTYNRMQRHDDMLALVDVLAADAKFLDGKPTLKDMLDHLKAQALAKRAERLEAEARASGDLAKYVACGGAYLDIYNRNPEAVDNDVMLYNAGVCYSEGKSISVAISLFNTLAKQYPRSKHAAKAVAQLGKAYGDIAYYREAAEKLEDYAQRYAGEQDAYHAMSDAVIYRKGIGDDAKAIEDTKYFVRMFGAKQAGDAAAADFALTAVYEKQHDSDAVIRQLRAYIHTFGATGGADRLVIAYAKLGQTIWAQSCPVAQVDGACVRITRARAVRVAQVSRRASTAAELPKQCGPESKIKLTVVPRDDRKMKDALVALGAATAEFEKRQGHTGGDEAGARYYYASAKLAEADRDYEAYLAIKFPAGLNFDPNDNAIAAKSMKRFDGWIVTKTKSSAAAAAKYAAVLQIRDNASSIAAAARLGQIAQNYADALFTSEIPKDVRTGPFAADKVDAFCDHMTTVAEPLEAKSLDAYGACLAESTKLGWFSDWSKLCERELGQIKPDQFPTASERRGDPIAVAHVSDIEPLAVKVE